MESGACLCGNAINSAVMVPKWSATNPAFTRQLIRDYKPVFVAAHPTEDLVLVRECPCHAEDIEFVEIRGSDGDIV